MKKLSPSQFKLFNECQRKWYYKYILRDYQPPHASAQLGTRVHKLVEDWLTDGTLPDEYEEMQMPPPYTKPRYPGQIARAAIAILPTPTTVETEKKIDFYTEAAPWTGRVDAVRWDPETRQVTVWDLKTTSNQDYALTEETITTDEQALLYAHWAINEYGLSGSDTVSICWVYSITKDKPRAFPVQASFSVDYVAQEVTKIDDIARKIMAFQLEPPYSVNELPKTLSSCNKYGGCPYREKCGITFSEILEGKEMARESLKELMERTKREREAEKGRVKLPVVPAQEVPAFEATATPSNVLQFPSRINPPEADAVPLKAEPTPAVEPRQPVAPMSDYYTPSGVKPEFEQLAKLERDQLKDIAVKLGLVPNNTRLKAYSLVKLIEGHPDAAQYVNGPPASEPGTISVLEQSEEIAELVKLSQLSSGTGTVVTTAVPSDLEMRSTVPASSQTQNEKIQQRIKKLLNELTPTGRSSCEVVLSYEDAIQILCDEFNARIVIDDGDLGPGQISVILKYLNA